MICRDALIRNVLKWSVAFAAVAMSATPALVHPHVFAEARLEVVVNPDHTVKALRHLWRFDDLFSSTVLLEFDKNADLKLDDAELEEVGKTVHESLAEYNYFQLVTENDKDVPMEPPPKLIANFTDQQLIIIFESKPKSPLKLSGKVDFGVYDPTFYTAIDFTDDAMMAVDNMPAGCTKPSSGPIPTPRSRRTSRHSRTPSSTIRPAPTCRRSSPQSLKSPAPPRMTPMFRIASRVMIAFAVALVCLSPFWLGHAHAQSSLGIGTNEAIIPSTGLFSGFTNWVNVEQQRFYRALTGSLKGMRQDSGQVWILVGLSFAYGIFHAAGPGHGKAVISSYMLANEVTLRRGIVLSFVSAFLQAATAIVVMTAVFLLLRGTAITMTNATWTLEIASYALITAFGAWLLYKKAWPRLAALFGAAPVRSLSAAAAPVLARSSVHDLTHGDHEHQGHVHGPACGHDHHHHGAHGRDHGHDDPHGHSNGRGHAHGQHSHGVGEVCDTCGHAHAPDPAMISGDQFNWKTAWSAVAAVGLRPCSGALIVLSFAFLNGLWVGGILSVLAMAVGTAITVSALATFAVTAKSVAVRFAGDGRMGNRVHAAIEIGGAALVFLVGLALLMASLRA